jgi:RNA polymerase sigma-70 factor (ECF subfamily)
MVPLEPTTSMTLLGQLRLTGQSAAWDRFNQLYWSLLVAWAKRHGLQDADAEDLAQDILSELKANLARYDREKGKFRAWLSTICKNRCRDQIRRQSKAREVHDGVALANLADGFPLTDLEEHEHQQALVNRGLEMIRGDFNDETWAAFDRMDRQGRKAGDVAGELGMTVNAAYLASNRVRTRLRREIAEFLD